MIGGKARTIVLLTLRVRKPYRTPHAPREETSVTRSVTSTIRFDRMEPQPPGNTMHAYASLVLLLLSASPPATQPSQPTPKEVLKMNLKQASLFARLALAGIEKEYPNKPDHVMNGHSDIKGPRALHPAFYGSFDWHSSVHGHWMLVRLLRWLPDLPERKRSSPCCGNTSRRKTYRPRPITSPSRIASRSSGPTAGRGC